MEQKNSDQIRIGKSIRNQTNLEKANRGQQRAAARFDVEMTSPDGTPLTHLWLTSQVYQPTHIQIRDIAGNFRGTSGSYTSNEKEEGSQYVSKNSSLGILLTSKGFGTHTYKAPKSPYGKKKILIDREISFSSKAVFRNNGTVKDLVIDVEGQPTKRYPTLNALLQHVDELSKEIDRKRKQQEEMRREAERIRKEQEERAAAIAKAEAEEAERLRIEAEREAEELRIKEELRRKEEEEIQRLEDERRIAEEKLVEAGESYRSGLEMRYQEVPDISQTQAKVSHLYDGVTLVIDGGPGTGKTTTSIGRLKFLIDPVLAEHETCTLSDSQISQITDPSTVKSHWIFISPSDLLAQYLRSALSAEGLANDIANVIPYLKFLSNNLLEYNITRIPSGKKPPFAKLRPEDPRSSRVLISNGKKTVNLFDKYLREQIAKPFIKAASLKTTDFDWHQCAVGIQYFCRQMKTIDSLMGIARILQDLRENDQERVKTLTEEMNQSIQRVSNRILKKVMADEETFEYLKLLFDDWDNINETADETDEVDIIEEEETAVEVESIEGRVFQRLKTLVKNLGIRKFDTSYSLKKKDREFYDLVKQHVDSEDLEDTASLAWFNRNFGSLCRGVENIMIRPILRLYKNFRREQLKEASSPYNLEMLKDIVSSNKNRSLHHDEQSLLLGFINNLMGDFRKRYPGLFGSFRNQFAQAYNRSVKYVIGVDEASDYSELDYWCIKSFSHPDFSAITLCGDIMQGLGSNGISSWDVLREWVFPKQDVFTLNTSYRQCPALLEVSRQMYLDDQGHEAPYTCHDTEKPMAAALAYVSRNENKKIDWLARRIYQVYDHFGNAGGLPSVAVFINDDENAAEFVEKLRNNEYLENYDVDDCTDNKQGRGDSIRVFHLSKVKGLEFEAAFFHNIDSLKMADKGLLRRHLYVGISRAVSHLGATFSNADSELLKYFETGEGNW